MSNLKAVDVTFCNIINLKNYVLTAYPLYLILGVPLKTISGIMYTPKSYLKIQGHNFEQWCQTLSVALKKVNSDIIEEFSECIVKERDFEYLCIVDFKEKHINIVLKQPATEDLCFLFDIQELKLFLLAFADLLIHVYCLPDNFMIIFHHVLCHFLSYKEWNSTKGEETIKNLKYSDVNKICKSTCSKYGIEGSLFNFTDTLFRHKINLCIMYLIKKNFSSM
jgi:hypothetical protein